MKTDNGLAIAFFAVVIGGAVALAAPLCDAAKIKSMAPDKIEFGCFEFWFNRYQTLIAAIIAAVTAAIVLRPALAQVSELRRQNSATAVQLLRLELDTIEAEVQFLGKMTSAMRDLRIAIEGAVVVIGMDQTPMKTEADLNGHINSVTFLRIELRDFAIMVSGGLATSVTRSDLMNWLDRLSGGERAKIYEAYATSDAAPTTEHDLAIRQTLDAAQQEIRRGFEKIGSHSKALARQRNLLAQQAATEAKAAIERSS